ncbi:MAG: rhomboid family intramembrane serine protease [Desulfatibacillum sp.]|nr:rhomboid family intramembrane serine protease [Desulfatibacillum sp.]
MIVIPLEGKIGWRNPPIVTILLIVINCVVLFGFQTNDSVINEEALDFYCYSGLADIEGDAYINWLDLRGRALPNPENFDIDEQSCFYIYYCMITNDEFMGLLDADAVISPFDVQYQTWKNLRQEYENLRRQSFQARYALVPAEHIPVTFVTSMFLHGGISHLIGNMIFLWIVGCILEMGVGRVAYLSAYLSLGVFSSLLFWAVNQGSHIPLVGASGAISGLMGAVAVLYGMTRINVFLSTGFYFNYVKVPALILLFFWVGKELFNHYLGGPSSTAYMAHAGGLLGGALGGIVYKQIMGQKAKEFFEEEKPDETPALLEQARAAIGVLDFNKARPILETVLEAKPNSLEALKLLFVAEKSQSENPSIHRTTARLLTALGGDSAAVADVYREYRFSVKRPALPAGVHLRVVKALVKQGRLQDAEKIVGAYLRQRPEEPGIAPALFVLGQAYETKGNEEKAGKCFLILERKYPRSQEAAFARSRSPK